MLLVTNLQISHHAERAWLDELDHVLEQIQILDVGVAREWLPGEVTDAVEAEIKNL